MRADESLGEEWRSADGDRPTDEEDGQRISWRSAMDAAHGGDRVVDSVASLPHELDGRKHSVDPNFFFVETLRVLNAALARSGIGDPTSSPRSNGEAKRTNGSDPSSEVSSALQPAVPVNGSASAGHTPLPSSLSSELTTRESDLHHWRERAVVWRERALASEALARELQGHIDDLRANIDDLRAAIASPSADAVEPTALESPKPGRRRRLFGKRPKPND